MATVVRIIPKSTFAANGAIAASNSTYLLSSLVINSSGFTLPSGTAVYVTPAANGVNSEIYPADPSDPQKNTVLGVLPTAVFSGATTRVAISGMVPTLLAANSTTPISGSTLYLSKDFPGYLTTEVYTESPAIRIGTFVAGTLALDISKEGEIAAAIHPEDSLWGTTSAGDLVVASILTGRSGSWVGEFGLDTLSTPPFVDWEYSDTAQNNATVVFQTKASKAKLSISNMDIKPKPIDIFPDIHWNKSGDDLIPRSVE